MLIRYTFAISLNFLMLTNLSAQNYLNDSMSIEIKYKNNFIVQDYKDLNINIVYLPKVKGKTIWVYQQLVDFYKSTFGNCYFELSRYDSSSNSYQDITSKIRGSGHPPKDFKNETEILTYDLEKNILSAHGKVLTFNLLNFMHTLIKGKYCVKFFIRTGNNYGYDSNGHIITNSICYAESKTMCFEVIKELETPNKILQ